MFTAVCSKMDDNAVDTLPAIVKRFFDNVQFISKVDGKVQLLAQCKRCRKK